MLGTMLTPDIKIRWANVTKVNQDRTRVLYAYLHLKRGNEVLYIGKADRASVHERWKADDKASLFRALEKQRNIYEHGFLVGTPLLRQGSRLTGQLLHDLESLYIMALQPWGNIQGRNSRGASRPGLVVENVGKLWPGPQFIEDR
jgi:hypothetical protein